MEDKLLESQKQNKGYEVLLTTIRESATLAPIFFFLAGLLVLIVLMLSEVLWLLYFALAWISFLLRPVRVLLDAIFCLFLSTILFILSSTHYLRI